MGVDYYVCEYCGETFPDAGYYVSCEECGTRWCSDSCAEEEGYVECHCSKAGFDIEDNMYCGENEDYCSDCKYYVQDSCGSCRGEIIEDWELLDFALDKLKLNREELVELYKNK